MDGTFTSLLTTTDWNEEWKRLQDFRAHADDPAVWDDKAKTFPVKHGSQEGYVRRFLELADVLDGEAVLDMGCGTGALATPLAQGGKHVIACDFSRGMLDAMIADQRELGVPCKTADCWTRTRHGADVRPGKAGELPGPGCGASRATAPGSVEAHLMSWDDNWGAHGIGDKSVDVAIASRSIATYDLQAALMKLDHVARRRVCLTLPCGLSPRTDERLLEAAGFERRLGRDFLYAFNILAAQGINPEVAYIPSSRMELFETFEEACEKFADIVRGAVEGLASDEEMAAIPGRMRPWLEANLVHDDRGYHLSEERRVTWAFIAWSPRG